MNQRYTTKTGPVSGVHVLLLEAQRQGASEADMQTYFQVTAPSVHQMVLTLEANGLIERTPGQARSIRLLIPRNVLPDLD